MCLLYEYVFNLNCVDRYQTYTAIIYVPVVNFYQNYFKSNMELQLEFEPY